MPFRFLLTAAFTLVLAGCATPRHFQPEPGLIPLADDKRVWHDADGQAYAGEVSRLLEPTIAKVEAEHGLPFLRPPNIIACAGAPCFKKRVPIPGYTAAVLPGEILALSPRLYLEENERLPAILAHELSHLHLGQRVGHYTSDLPIWFHEGLASLVADGGGAEFSSDEEACNAWDSGRRIDFAQLDSPKKRHRAADFKMSIHQFYRQSWRFLQYLKRRDAPAFGHMLRAIQGGTPFTTALADAYRVSLEQLGLEFEFDSR